MLNFLVNEDEVDLKRDMVSRDRNDGERAVCVVLVVLGEVHRSNCAPKALLQYLIQFPTVFKTILAYRAYRLT